MPRLNLYEQQTTAQGPRASGAEFGAAPAQALDGAGNVLQDIGERIQRREELGAAQDVMEGVDTWAVSALDDFQKRQDIMTAQALPEFQNALNQKRQEALSNFTGRPEARAALERQLDNQLAQYGKSAITAKIKAGQDQMGRALDQQFNKSMMQVDAAPDIWSFAKDENMAAVEMWKPAMTKDQYESAKRLAYAKPLQAAVRSHLAQGNIEGAEKLMTDESFSKYLTMEEARPLRIDAAVGRGKVQKEQRELETNARQWEFATGNKIDPAKYAELPDFKSATAAQKIASHRLVFGTDPTDQQKEKYAGIDRQNSESKVQQITDLAMGYDTLDANGRMKLGLLIKSEFRDINGVDQYGNPTRYSTVPAELQRFVDPTGGRPGAGGGITGSVATGAGNDTGPFLDPKGQMYPAGTKLIMPDGVPVTIDSRGHAIADDGSAGPAQPADDEDLVNLYDNADKVVGVESWVKRNWANLPLGIGDATKVNPLYGTAARAAYVLQNDIVRGLVNMGGGKDAIANQYRQELKKIVSIDPAIIGSDREYRIKLKTIDQELRKKLKDYEKTAQSGATQEMRQVAAEGVSVINSVIARLDVPQKKVVSQQDYEKLQPGERYLWLDDPTPRIKGGRK